MALWFTIVVGVTVGGLAVRIVIGIRNSLFGPAASARRRLHAAGDRLVDGEHATLTGTAQLLGEPLIAPLSGKACIVHLSRARLYRPRGRTTELVAEPSELGAQSFALDTRDGRILVEASAIEFALPFRPIIPRSIARETDFIRKHGFDAKLVFQGGFDEILVRPGDRVSVHGVVARERMSADTAGYRDAPLQTKLVDAQGPITIGRK